ncbi:hypothetical protein CASFOL_021223 [Castilleja foliolosa]|uniref:Uncharacterized protein n=1 Tax=Castilleja foliolosa TaxID=1961234 RepID=A0ABD3CX57_9LAMI
MDEEGLPPTALSEAYLLQMRSQSLSVVWLLYVEVLCVPSYQFWWPPYVVEFAVLGAL